MNNGVIITAIICATLVVICWMGNKKGDGKNGKS